MEFKTCTRCHIEKPLEEFYKDSHAKDGRTSACKPCRSRQVSRAESRRLRRSQGKVLEERPELLEHNLETLQRIIELEERPLNIGFSTQLIGAIEPFERGLVIRDGMAYIETVHGRTSKDLKTTTIKALARFLENHRLKIIGRIDT